MTPELQSKIDETNRLARQFNVQNYVNMILKTYQTDPQQARIECKWWMDNHPLVLKEFNEKKNKNRTHCSAMLAMRKIELARRQMESIQPKVPSLRGADMQEHATNEHQRGKAGRTNRGEHFRLGEIWNAGIRASAFGS